MSARSLVKSLMRGSVALTCAAYLVHDWYSGRRLRRGMIESDSGTFSRDYDVDRSIEYVENVHRALLEPSGRARFSGTVAEIGPGDNLGLALLLRAQGADAWHGVDRFWPKRDLAHESAIHRELARRLGREDLLKNGGQDVDGAYYHAGVATETFFRDGNLAFDVILSSAALEHVVDPIGALDDMMAALKPGGIMVHRIDLRDHGMFDPLHPLTFLTVAEPIYRRMVRNSGRPNRVMLAEYRRWAANCGVPATVGPFWMVGRGRETYPIDDATRAVARAEVTAMRPRFARRFRAQSDEDLMVSGFALVVRKPA
jgi:SAM-dependent methyltransferase